VLESGSGCGVVHIKERTVTVLGGKSGGLRGFGGNIRGAWSNNYVRQGNDKVFKNPKLRDLRGRVKSENEPMIAKRQRKGCSKRGTGGPLDG